jgi:hypothetical protein
VGVFWCTDTVINCLLAFIINRKGHCVCPCRAVPRLVLVVNSTSRHFHLTGILLWRLCVLSTDYTK